MGWYTTRLPATRKVQVGRSLEPKWTSKNSLDNTQIPDLQVKQSGAHKVGGSQSSRSEWTTGQLSHTQNSKAQIAR